MKTLATIIAMMGMAIPLSGCKDNPPAPLELVRVEATGPRGSVRIRGQIHNPRTTPARGVVVAVEVLMDDCRTPDAAPKQMKPATAKIAYLPAGATVDFAGSASYPAPDDYQSYKQGKVTITESSGS